MISQDAIQRLCSCIETQLNHPVRTPKDFEQLSQLIDERLHQHVSTSTLKRLWGYVTNEFAPRTSTLNILAQFAGYADFALYPAPRQHFATEQDYLPLFGIQADDKGNYNTESDEGSDSKGNYDYNSMGIAQRLGDVMTSSMKEVKTYAGESAEIADGSTLGNLMQELQTKMSNFKTMMSAFESKLYKKYDALEVALSQLGTQLNYITGGQ